MPVVSLERASRPTAVLLTPMVLLASANDPFALLPKPLVLLEKRCSTSGGVSICGIKQKRSSTNTGVQVAGADGCKRKPINCCVECAADEAKKSLLALCSVATGIIAIRRRTDGLNFCQRRSATRQITMRTDAVVILMDVEFRTNLVRVSRSKLRSNSS